MATFLYCFGAAQVVALILVFWLTTPPREDDRTSPPDYSQPTIRKRR